MEERKANETLNIFRKRKFVQNILKLSSLSLTTVIFVALECIFTFLKYFVMTTYRDPKLFLYLKLTLCITVLYRKCVALFLCFGTFRL